MKRAFAVLWVNLKRYAVSIIALVGASLGAIAQYAASGDKSDITIWLFGFIAFELFFDKVTYQTKILDKLNNTSVVTLRRDLPPMEQRIQEAKKQLIITGVSNYTIHERCLDIQEALTRGCSVIIVFTDPKECVTAPLADFLGRSYTSQVNHLVVSITEIKKVLGKTMNDPNLKFLFYPRIISGAYVCIDKDSVNGIIYRQTYIRENSTGGRSPVVTLRNADSQYRDVYDVFNEEVNTIMEEAQKNTFSVQDPMFSDENRNMPTAGLS